MVDDPLAARPRRFDHLDVEQEHADRDDEVAERHRHAAIEHRRYVRLRGERNGEHRVGERHVVQEKDDDVEERKREQQEGKSDEIHGVGFLRAGVPAQSLAAGMGWAKAQTATSLIAPVLPRACARRPAQASFFDLSTWRPRYMPVLRSTWCG